MNHINAKAINRGDWKNKIIRVFLPYTLFETAFIWTYENVTLGSYFLDTVGIKPNYWYIGILTTSYFVFWIVILNQWMYHHRYWILSLVSATLLLFGDALHAEQAISFLIGVMISDLYTKTKKLADRKSMIVITFAVGICLLALKQIPFVRGQEGTHLCFLYKCV